MRTKKSPKEQAEKLTFRLAPQYAAKVAEICEASGLTPNQFGRVATMAMAQNRFLDLADTMTRMEDVLIRFRNDFNNAVAED